MLFIYFFRFIYTRSDNFKTDGETFNCNKRCADISPFHQCCALPASVIPHVTSFQLESNQLSPHMLMLLLLLPLKCPLMHCTHPLARIGHVCTQALTASHVNKPAPKCLTDTFEMSPSVWLVLPFFWPHSSRCGRNTHMSRKMKTGIQVHN